MGFDGDVGRGVGSGRDHQRLVVTAAVALEVSKGLIELAAGGRCPEVAGQAGGNQFAAIEHQAVFELLGLFHVRGGNQQRQLRTLTPDVINQFPEAPPGQRIDAGGRFIEDQQVGFMNQRTTEAELLFHAAR